jgi:RNA-directed DNA polymerase
VREIYAPDENVKTALKRVNNILTKTYESRNISFQVAYKTGKSIVDNADPHKKNNFMVKIDISNFFPSCKRELVKKYLRFMFLKSEERLLDEFLDIILVNDALVIGAPISGIIANTIISAPVAMMKKRCDKCGVAFTVYADDMTFSSETFLRKEFVQDIFTECMTIYKLNDYFKINPEKIVGISAHRRRVTGVSINVKDELCVRRRMYREARSILEHISHDKPVTYNKHEISGKLAFITMVENSAKVNALLEKYKDIIISEKLMSEKTLEKRGIHV